MSDTPTRGSCRACGGNGQEGEWFDDAGPQGVGGYVWTGPCARCEGTGWDRQADAVRYRFLRGKLAPQKWRDIDWILERPDDAEKYVTAEGLDAAIDEAMRRSDAV